MPVQATKTKRRRYTSYQLILLALVVPFVLFVVMFSYVPILGWSMAFVKYRPGMSIFDCVFVGLENFKRIFTYSNDFPVVMRNTLAMSFLGILTSPLPIALAIAVSQLRSKKYQRTVQTLTSLPNFISWVIIFGISFVFFAIDGGVVNDFLLFLGVIKAPTNALGNNDIVWFFQTALSVWKGVGWTAIIYFGAIAGIDQELYEAAQIDGAGRWKQVLHVTVPGLMPTFVVMLLLSVGSLLSGTSFEQIYVFHNNLVHQNIQTLDYYVYTMGIKRFDFSISTALGVFNSLVSLILLFTCNFISKKVTDQSIL
jgi:putative aldouronate transport system permease protein